MYQNTLASGSTLLLALLAEWRPFRRVARPLHRRRTKENTVLSIDDWFQNVSLDEQVTVYVFHYKP